MTLLLKKAGLDTNDLKKIQTRLKSAIHFKDTRERSPPSTAVPSFRENNLLEIRQSAYRKKTSTETAVFSVLKRLLTKFDQKLVSMPCWI